MKVFRFMSREEFFKYMKGETLQKNGLILHIANGGGEMKYKEKPNFDTTYCMSEKCIEKCWRHASNFNFEEGKLYWYMERCENERTETK